MAIDDTTRSALTALWEVGSRHGRTPEPVPEADPWEDDDPAAAEGWLPVVFPGVPSVVARLHRDQRDLVVVEDQVEIDVPRRDTAAVVQELLAGRAYRRSRVRGGAWRAVAAVLGTLMPDDVVVVVGPPQDRRTYTAPLAAALGGAPGSWALALQPEPRDPGPGGPGPGGPGRSGTPLA